MRIGPISLALALVVIISPALGQTPRVSRAFANSVTPWIGLSGYGNRFNWEFQDERFKARYRGSPTAGIRLDVPLTRRAGFLANVAIAPFSAQRVESNISSRFEEDATIYRADAGLGWRFKPQVPLFMYVGGGVVGASRVAYPGVSGSVLDPAAALAIGYDTRGAGRWNFRVVYASYLVFPSEPSSVPAGVETKSVVHDWAIQTGARVSLTGKR